MVEGRPARALLTDRPFLAVVALTLAGTLGTSVLSAALPTVSVGLAVPESRVGLLLTAFKASATVAALATGALADLRGRRLVVLPSLVGFGFAGVAMAGADSFGALLGLALLLGVGFAGVMPLSITLLGDAYAGPTGSTAQGLRTAVGGIGVFAFPALAGLLAGVGWRYPFLLYAGALPAAAVAYAFVPRHTTRARGASESVAATLRRYAGAMRAELARPSMRVLVGGGFLRDFVRLGVYTFTPLYAVGTLGATPFQAGLVLSIKGVVSVFASPALGALVAAASRKRVFVAAFVLSGVGAGLLALAPTVWWLGAAFAVYALGDAVASPVVKDGVSDTAVDARRAGTVGALNVLKNGGQAVAPAAFGAVLALSTYGTVFALAGVLAVGYGVLALVALAPDV
jgi:MFS family permease